MFIIQHRIFRVGNPWIDADVSKYFDTIRHGLMREVLDLRITDGVIRRMIDKWLKAGVLEEGVLRRSEIGTPQGCVISPCLWERSHKHKVLITLHFKYFPAHCAG